MNDQKISVPVFDDTLGIPVFKEVSVLQSQEQPPEFQKKQLLYVIGFILIVILFIYVAVSGGILKVITGTIVLTPIIFFIWVIMISGSEHSDGGAAAIIFCPSVSVFTFSILTIIMAIYNFTTPTPSTIV